VSFADGVVVGDDDDDDDDVDDVDDDGDAWRIVGSKSAMQTDDWCGLPSTQTISNLPFIVFAASLSCWTKVFKIIADGRLLFTKLG